MAVVASDEVSARLFEKGAGQMPGQRNLRREHENGIYPGQQIAACKHSCNACEIV
jgi:hypothetical protein